MKLFLSIVLSAALFVGGGLASQAHAQSVVNGCTSANGYSATTGMSCNGITAVPAGCSTTAGFSGTTGTACNSSSASINGYNGTIVGANGYLNGCVSTGGYSTTTGYPCNMALNGYIYTGNGTTVNVGGTTNTTTPVVTTAPGLPTTGGSNNALPTALVLVASGLVVFGSVRYGMKKAA